MTAKQKSRTLSFSRRPGSSEGILTIRDRGEFTRYWLREVPCELPGRAFRMEKFESDRRDEWDDCYWVRVGPEASCDCKGHHRWGWKTPCKHLAAVRKLIEEGKL